MKKIIIMGLLLVPIMVMGQSMKRNAKIIRGTIVQQSFSLEDDDNSMSELSFPIQVIWPVNPDLNLQLVTTPANASYGDYSMGGLSDTYMKSTYLFAEKKGMVGLGLGLPTGATELDSEQQLISSIISTNVLRFQLPVYGQGFTVNLGLAYAQPVNEKMVVGGGLSYVFRGKYKPVENSVAGYNPGDQFAINLGADYLLNEQMKLYFDIVYNLYMADQSERDGDIFNSGSKMCFNVGFLMNTDFYMLLVNGVFRQKGKNEFLYGSELIAESENSNGPQAELDATLRYGINEKMAALGFAVIRAYGENGYKSGDAALFGLGGGADYVVSPKVTIDGALKFYFGRMGGGSAARSLSGFEFLLGFTMRQ